MTTVQQLLDRLDALIAADRANADLPVFATHGDSGSTDPVGTPHIREVTEDDVVPLDYDLREGDKYVNLYIGN